MTGPTWSAFGEDIHRKGSPRLPGSASPIWHRGLIPGAEEKRRDADGEDIERVLAAFGVRVLVVGHATQRRGISTYHGGRVHAIDADLQSGAPGELWLYRNE